MRFPWQSKGPSVEDLRLAEMTAMERGRRQREQELLRQAEAEAYEEQGRRDHERYVRESQAAHERQQAQWERRAREAFEAQQAVKVDRLRRGEMPFDPPPAPKPPPVEVFIRPDPYAPGASGVYRTMATGVAFHGHHYY